MSKLQAEIEKTLEKISSREKYINSQLEGLIADFRAQQDALSSQSGLYGDDDVVDDDDDDDGGGGENIVVDFDDAKAKFDHDYIAKVSDGHKNNDDDVSCMLIFVCDLHT